MAIGVLAVAVFLLYRRITLIEKFGKFLWIGVAIAIAWVIFAGTAAYFASLWLMGLRPRDFSRHE